MSCSNKNETINKSENQLIKEKQKFDFSSLGYYGNKKELLINVEFSECGEWGGHQEKIVIHTKEDSKSILNYQKFRVDCDSIDYLTNGRPIQIKELEKEIELKNENKLAITDYMRRMMESKIEEYFMGDAANCYSIALSDSTLVIQVCDEREITVQSYNKLLKELDLLK